MKKINFFYGANGTGKTTLSKLIYSPENPNYAHCSLVWQDNNPLKVLVYNRDFKDRNFGKGAIEGVFTLGEATKQEIEEINQMTQELDALKDSGSKRREALKKLSEQKNRIDDQFRDSAWNDVYKEYEDVFKQAFAGVMRKDAFKLRLLEEYKNNSTTLLTYEHLIDKAQIIFGPSPGVLPLIPLLSINQIFEREDDEIWSKKIIGKQDVDIAGLIQRLNINDWVNTGRSHLSSSEVCPFCQQNTITKDFRKKLSDYFDQTFIDDINYLEAAINNYQKVFNFLIVEFRKIENDERSNSESKLQVELFSSVIQTAETQFHLNSELLNGKRKEPSRIVTLTSLREHINQLLSMIIEANKEITEHNLLVQNFSTERQNLISGIWRYITNNYSVRIDSHTSTVEGMQRGIESLEIQIGDLLIKYRALDEKIKEANTNVTSIQPSIDQINKTLSSFGFTNFKIVSSPGNTNQYQIQREDGQIAESTLSEGESTFITFLYFIQLCKGSLDKATITEERILVIDDPISSLDSNILFVVSTLVKEIAKRIRSGEGNVKQLILLTHNVYFHKEVSFIDGRTSKLADTYYWMIRKKNNITTIQCYEMDSPIQNSYSMLWQELRNRNLNSGVSIQNTMRRIIENYFRMLGKFGDDDLIRNFETNEEKEICRSLISWINDGSHSISDDLYVEHHETTQDKYFEVFKGIFQKMVQSEHFNMMMN